MVGLKFLTCAWISSITAVFLRTDRYELKSTVCGAAWRAASFRRASSLRFLKARRDEAVWPLRPREEEIVVQSIFEAAER